MAKRIRYRMVTAAGDKNFKDGSTTATLKAITWTIAFSRKLVTDSKTDVEFDKLDGTYYFGIAFFDNAQVRHAYNTGALKLMFAK